MISFAILMFPFLQFGVNWWVTTSSVWCLAILVRVIRSIEKPKLRADSSLFLIVVLLLVVYIWQDFGNLHLFLRISREALILILLAYFSNNFSPKTSINFHEKVDFAIFIFVVFEFFLVLIQFISLSRGVWIGPNPSWLAGRGNLLPDLLDLKYSKLRPSGTFSEPSYLGMVCLAIFVLVSRQSIQSLKTRSAYLLTIFTIVLSQSKSALYFLIVLIALKAHRDRTIKNRKVNTFILPLVIFTSVPLFSLIFDTFLSSRGSVSVQSRIFIPLSYSLEFLFSHPLGTPFYDRLNKLIDNNSSLTWEVISHNAIFNLIFSYGIVGLLIILRILVVAKRDSVIYVFIFALLLQNGSFLDFDKLFLLTTVLGVMRMNNVENSV